MDGLLQLRGTDAIQQYNLRMMTQHTPSTRILSTTRGEGEKANPEWHVYWKMSTRYFQSQHFGCVCPPCFGETRLGKPCQGVCCLLIVLLIECYTVHGIQRYRSILYLVVVLRADSWECRPGLLLMRLFVCDTSYGGVVTVCHAYYSYCSSATRTGRNIYSSSSTW